MSDLSSVFNAVGLVDCVVLEYQSEKCPLLVLYGENNWFKLLLPKAKKTVTEKDIAPIAFLNDFMRDAKEHWQSNTVEPLHSGIWTESLQVNEHAHKELRLEAIAFVLQQRCYLIINNVQRLHDERQKTLQSAREVLLSHDRMQAEHDYLTQKLQIAIKRNSSLLELKSPVEKALENSTMGALILDSNKHLLFCNQAAYDFFDMCIDSVESPKDIVVRLLQSQYPEITSAFSSTSDWNGELFWPLPRHGQKWFQTSICPIINSIAQVTHWVITLSDTTRIKFLLQKNEDMKLQDALTGLPNRHYLWRRLQQLVTPNKKSTLLLIDIVKFKRINELYGHAIGDQCLQDIAHRLKTMQSESIDIARVGSARFAILQSQASELTLKQREQTGRSLYNKASELLTEPFSIGKQQAFQITLNAGAAVSPFDGDNPERLFTAADMAMNDAYSASSNTFRMYHEHMLQRREQRLLVEKSLKYAIENNELVIYLQPILDTASEKVVKAEALLRWTTVDHQAIPPDVFIPIAEQTGQIIALGEWVIQQVCDVLAEMHKQGIDIKLSINLSPKQVSDKYLFDFIRRTTHQSGVNAKKLELELTEGVLINNYATAANFLSALRELGVSIAIDDFGTGYSSLSYLKHLPIDYLKIDRSFVQDLDINKDDRAIVLAIIAMAKQLNLSVIAEGVETDSQRDFLKEHHCEALQGFLYSKPLPVNAFFEFYHRQNKAK